MLNGAAYSVVLTKEEKQIIYIKKKNEELDTVNPE